MIRTYSLARDADHVLSQNFKVREFACKDGSDTVLIDDHLVSILQETRIFFNRPIKVQSGYRTVAYNTKIGGANGSYHCKGMAADIDVGNAQTGEINPKVVAMFLEARGVKGIGRYIYADGQKWIHCDSRTAQSFWTQAKPNSLVRVETFLPILRKPALFGIWKNAEEVKILQYILQRLGYSLDIDGKFWNDTLFAVKAFQKQAGITVDGIVGGETWKRLFIILKRWE